VRFYKMRKDVIILLSILSFTPSICQTSNELFLENLKKELTKTRNDSIRARIYYKLSNKSNDPLKMFLYADSGYAISKRKNLINLQCMHLEKMGFSHTLRGNFDTASIYLEKAKISAKKASNLTTYEVYKTYGFLKHEQNEIDSAYYYYGKALTLSKDLNTQRQITLNLNYVSLYREEGRINDAIDLLIECLELNRGGSKRIEAGIYANLGNLYLSIKNHEESENYYNKSINLFNQLGFTRNAIIASLNLAQTMIDNFKDEEAILIVDSLINNNSLQKTALSLAYSHLSQAHRHLKNYKKALYYAKKNIIIDQSINSNRGLGTAYFRIMAIAQQMNDFELAQIYLDSSRMFGKKEVRNQIANKKAQVVNGLFLNKEPIQIATWLEEYISLKDSIYSEKLATIIKEKEEKYNKKENENEILQLTNENIQKKASLAQYRYTNFGILGVFILVLSLGYFYWNKRKQTHQLDLLENSIQTSEQEKVKIGKELHDNIAGTLMQLVHDSETAQLRLSHKLLQTYHKVRNLSHQLDNSPMHGELFLDRILDIVPDATAAHEFVFDIKPRHLQLSEPQGTHIFRIIQELITNNLKYAKATKTQISIVLEKEKIRLNYDDNGVGTTHFKKGNGYKNIDNRLALMNGKLEIRYQNGFSTTLTIPYSS